jgi:hypothetical protein
VCTLPPPVLAAPVVSFAPPAPSAGVFPGPPSSYSVPSAPGACVPSVRQLPKNFTGIFQQFFFRGFIFCSGLYRCPLSHRST